MSTGEDPSARARTYVDPAAVVEPSANVGDGSRVWGLAQVRAGAVLGQRCVVGRGAFVDQDVVVGDDCKIQNQALLYAPARLGAGVFVGPAVVLTNDLYPRAVNPDGSVKSASDWEPVGVVVRDGASIGARAVCVAPVEIGRWAMVAAGAVVVSDVPDHALVAGVPARRVGWVGRAGHRLESDDGLHYRCPATGETYRDNAGALVRDT